MTGERPADRVITPSALRAWPLPGAGGSKRSRGHVLVAGGNASTPGAVLLAGLAALRVGAGVLAMAVAGSVAGALAVAVPEASVLALPGLDDADAPGRGTEPGLDPALDAATTVLLGPGLDNPNDAERLLRQTLAGLPGEATLVLDAFALGVLPGVDGVRDAAGGRLVLTPNHAEAARLLDSDEDELPDDDDRIAAAIAERYGAAVSFSDTVAAGDRTWVVPSGHAGLGTSGSGDVLAGAAAGLLARGADPAQAACWATYLHATAGDRLAPRVGRLGFLARELVDELPRVLVQTEA